MLLVLCGGISANSLAAAEKAGPALKTVRGFVSNYCVDCHQGSGAEAGLDLATLELAFEESEMATFADWVRAHDRVRDEEMPPPDYAEVPSDEQQEFLDALGLLLSEHQSDQFARQGRVPTRRLTIAQLERTLQDLLGIDIPLANRIPPEPRSGKYSTLAHLQSLSHFQMASIVEVIDVALEEAFRRAGEGEPLRVDEMTAKQISRKRKRCREPEYINDAAVVWSSRLSFYGRIPATKAKRDGWYRFRIAVSALKRPAGHGVWCTIRSGRCVSSAPLMSWIGHFAAQDEPREIEFTAWLPAGHMLEIRPGDTTLKMARFKGGQAANGEGGAQDVPGIAIHSLTMKQVHRGPDDAQLRSQLLGDLAQFLDGREVPSAGSEEYARLLETANGLIADFARRAWRRPPGESDLTPFHTLFENTLAETGQPLQALRAAYRAVLCSARFLFLQESTGRLDDHAIATRLSYALANTTPDPELMRLADAGKLHEPAVLKQQIERLLSAEGGRRFLEDFAAQWLLLDQIEATEPDRRRFRDFDLIVQQSMLDETHAFLAELLSEDRPIAELIGADYTYLNNRLARFYGIDGVAGDAMRRVDAAGIPHRGGLLGQGAILKVTANGSHTSPVVRGVWVADRLLGVEIPPPPDSVPAIEPDVRGATTIRQQLARHRADPQCAACHRKFDPAGFALENFDAAGRWREKYPKRVKGKWRPGPGIDPSGELRDGTKFATFQAFRRIQSERDAALAASFVEELLTYATGAPIEFADRRAIEQIVASTAENRYGFRSLLVAALTSDIFLHK